MCRCWPRVPATLGRAASHPTATRSPLAHTCWSHLFVYLRRYRALLARGLPRGAPCPPPLLPPFRPVLAGPDMFVVTGPSHPLVVPRIKIPPNDWRPVHQVDDSGRLTLLMYQPCRLLPGRLVLSLRTSTSSPPSSEMLQIPATRAALPWDATTTFTGAGPLRTRTRATRAALPWDATTTFTGAGPLRTRTRATRAALSSDATTTFTGAGPLRTRTRATRAAFPWDATTTFTGAGALLTFFFRTLPLLRLEGLASCRNHNLADNPVLPDQGTASLELVLYSPLTPSLLSPFLRPATSSSCDLRLPSQGSYPYLTLCSPLD